MRCRSISLKPLSFPKTDRILKRHEFLAFYSLGKVMHSPGFILVYKRGISGRFRIGITVSRKVGHAVTRNRVKRRIREYYRLHRAALPVSWDIHVIAKKPASSLTFQQTVTTLESLFAKFVKTAGAAIQVVSAIGFQ
jgi:ribonuclease P protein component